MKQIARWYLKIVEAICVCLLLVILGCMCIQIVCRLFTIGQNFTEELSRLSFSLLIFLGAPLALAEGADISRRHGSQHFTEGNPQSSGYPGKIF